MQITPIHEQQSFSSRRYGLEGDARPGDVLALAGGALVRDRNANGVIDGPDVPVGTHVRGGLIWPYAPHGAVAGGRNGHEGGPDRALGVDALVRGTGRFRGGLVDVRG